MISCCLVSQRLLNCNQAGTLFQTKRNTQLGGQTIRFMIICRKQYQSVHYYLYSILYFKLDEIPPAKNTENRPKNDPLVRPNPACKWS